MSTPTATRSVRLVLAGSGRPLAATPLPEIISRHTGKGIERIELTFAVGEQLTDSISTQLQDARRPEMSLHEEATDNKWIVEDLHYTILGNQDRSEFTVTLRQLEPLDPASLTFLGITVTPERYAEDALDEESPIAITFEFTVSHDEIEEFEESLLSCRSKLKPQYFDLVRTGIDETPIHVRTGRCLWQEIEDGRRHQITLVREENDNIPTRSPAYGEPALSRSIDEAISSRQRLDTLIKELAAASLLSPEAVTRIAAAAEVKDPRVRRIFERTENLDAFWI